MNKNIFKEVKKENKRKEKYLKDGIKLGIGLVGLGIGLKSLKENIK